MVNPFSDWTDEDIERAERGVRESAKFWRSLKDGDRRDRIMRALSGDVPPRFTAGDVRQVLAAAKQAGLDDEAALAWLAAFIDPADAGPRELAELPATTPAPLAERSAPLEGAPRPPAATDWGAEARTVARAIIERQRALDLYPPQWSIADEVAADLRKRGIFGPGGKPLTGATIKRHALRGIASTPMAAPAKRGNRGK